GLRAAAAERGPDPRLQGHRHAGRRRRERACSRAGRRRLVAVDFEEIWHTHKRFILQVAGGALTFSVLLFWQQGIAGAAVDLSKKNAGQQAELQDDIAALLGAEGLEKGRAEALGERLEPAVLEAVLWNPGDSFKLPKGEK